ncbi:hypothetical protein MKW92_027441 [Papaver armeniacum]|nr:hypothetical protein MKW92_027441 [Papaver armeniacum]
MSLQPQNSPNVAEERETTLSKKAAKKEAVKKDKALKRQQEAAAAAALAAASIEEADPLSENYGELIEVQDLKSKGFSGRKWTDIRFVNESLKDKTVLVRGRIHTTRPVSKNIGFLVLREKGCTIQCVLTVADNLISRQMVKFATSLTKESHVDVEGIVSKIFAISKALSKLPLNFVDAARSEADIEKALQAGEQLVRVNQDTRLNFRVLDLRTPANRAIFCMQSQVETEFRQYLLSKEFIGIHTPKLMAGSSEGGASVFRLTYKGGPACLAQSPQLHKQMSIIGDLGRVFEIGPVFRDENCNSNRHLCEYIGLDAEMEFKEDYSELMDVVDGLFVAMFDSLNENCQKELEAIGKQYPFEPLKYLRETPRLTFKEGVQMLKEAGAEKYGTDFYILHRYPLAVRPFYTMPAYDNPEYRIHLMSLWGEEIISGSQRVHQPELLITRAQCHGIDLKSIESYIEAFWYGAAPHGGFGVGLERVVMLFCGLNNIRKTSLFPRDPQRITP